MDDITTTNSTEFSKDELILALLSDNMSAIFRYKPNITDCFLLAFKLVGNYVVPQQGKIFSNYYRNLLKLGLFFSNLADEQVTKKVESLEKNLIDMAVAAVDRLPNKDAILMEFKQVNNVQLSIISILFAKYLFKISFSEEFETDIRYFDVFLLLFGLHLYIFKEWSSRIMQANKVNLEDPETLSSNPLYYLWFWIFSEMQGDIKKSQQIMNNFLHKCAERATVVIYHPDDPDWTKNKKFVFIEHENLKTEAEGIYDVLFTKTLKEKFSRRSWFELSFVKQFEWDVDLKSLPIYYRRDLVNEIESQQAKQRGITIEDLRKLREEINELRNQVNRGGAPPEKLEEAEKKFEELNKKEINIVYTDQEDFEGVPTEKQAPNEVAEYIFANPYEVVESFQEQEYATKEVEIIIVEHTNSLSPQAKAQKKVGNFLVNSGVRKYINENTGRFKIEEIHEESGIPLKTVKRFCEGLFNKYRIRKI